MIRVALAALALSGCTIVEHVQVLPTVAAGNDIQLGCCVVYAELPPSTQLSVSVKKGNAGVSVKAGARWRF